METTCYANMPTRVEEDTVLGYLGYRGHGSRPSDSQLALIRRYLSSLRPSGACRLVPLERKEEGIWIEGISVIQSERLSRYLSGCTHVLLMLSTLPREVTDPISKLFLQGHGEKGVLLDACASAVADSGLSYMAKAWETAHKKQRMTLLSTRVSPGYGDLPLSLQPEILTLLEGRRLHVSVTSECMLMPEKSVIAMQGGKIL